LLGARAPNFRTPCPRLLELLHKGGPVGRDLEKAHTTKVMELWFESDGEIPRAKTVCVQEFLNTKKELRKAR
jgi:hypothetical protein